jgi:hypothetical protein
MRKFRILLLSVIILVLTTIFALSCIKGNKTAIKPTMSGVKATIINTGPVAADGCDYLIQTDSATFYHADNLPTEFQKDKLTVTLNYELSGAAFQCGMNPNTRIPVIHIKDIKNR